MHTAYLHLQNPTLPTHPHPHQQYHHPHHRLLPVPSTGIITITVLLLLLTFYHFLFTNLNSFPQHQRRHHQSLLQPRDYTPPPSSKLRCPYLYFIETYFKHKYNEDKDEPTKTTNSFPCHSSTLIPTVQYSPSSSSSSSSSLDNHSLSDINTSLLYPPSITGNPASSFLSHYNIPSTLITTTTYKPTTSTSSPLWAPPRPKPPAPSLSPSPSQTPSQPRSPPEPQILKESTFLTTLTILSTLLLISLNIFICTFLYQRHKLLRNNNNRADNNNTPNNGGNSNEADDNDDDDDDGKYGNITIQLDPEDPEVFNPPNGTSNNNNNNNPGQENWEIIHLGPFDYPQQTQPRNHCQLF
ncbi:hypothetical protein AOL_s00043g769 [Orbilia oligospora ATCC 24927]|uniref:Uncharacterized protein n=1 Tax=Arthrobotrys oligospora (strain ATCC 24927 / CBS 115.81 / DSM 1491) TaxID=756982 RepID=G1X4Z5_ARTOA|nr:hypothetical protein AOL_s00043g769 [Orbilia oligospora ATCC 24927]EGX51750.1 hypothetical protein AOL_s00043g769 [Orbilia oligospora ATCC 24927]